MKLEPADHHCLDSTGHPDHVLRVLTGKVLYRLSSVRGSLNAGPHVWVRQVHPTGELGKRKLVQIDSLVRATDYVTLRC